MSKKKKPQRIITPYTTLPELITDFNKGVKNKKLLIPLPVPAKVIGTLLILGLGGWFFHRDL